jgi:SanA protein
MITQRIKKRRVFFGVLVLLIAVSWFSISWCDQKIQDVAQNKLYSDTSFVPHCHVGLLLGTAKYLSTGEINLYYSLRIEAAHELIQASKIDYLIISGDNGQSNYNEPRMMKDDLIGLGVDSNRVFLDYAGFRTFDSMVRVKEVFGQDSVTLISQQFHNERAIYIANRIGVYAIGYNAKEVGWRAGVKTRFREKLARVKVFVDFLIGTEPKFLGQREYIP